jgi:hypothetical protein
MIYPVNARAPKKMEISEGRENITFSTTRGETQVETLENMQKRKPSALFSRFG